MALLDDLIEGGLDVATSTTTPPEFLPGEVDFSRDRPTLPPAPTEELSGISATIAAIESQLVNLQQNAELKQQLFDQFPDLFGSTIAAGELAGERLGPTQEDRDLINAQINQQLAFGEADINRARDQGLQNNRDVLAPGRGLRPGDSPILNEASGVVEAAQFQQGQLVRGLRSTFADQLFAREQFTQVLRQNAFQNRLGLSTTAGNFGLELSPNLNIAGALSTLQAPRLAENQVGATGSTGSAPSSFGSIAGGINSLANAVGGIASIQTGGTARNPTTIGTGVSGAIGDIFSCWVAAEFYGWYTPEWFAARNWIAEDWHGLGADLFRKVYLRHGRRIARWVRSNRIVREALRPVFAWAVRKGS